jgi:hypothetical protein
MKLYTRLAIAGAALLAVVAACDDNPFIIGDFGVAGRWTGSTRVGNGADSVRFSFDLTLEQDRGDVSGEGEIRGGTAVLPVDVDGTWAATGSQVNVRLEMSSEQIAPLTFTGVFDTDSVPRMPPDSGKVLVTDTDTLVGTLKGSSLDGVKLSLGRAAAP